MTIREITVKTIISRSQIYDYTLNPYVGCGHGCSYCYARFMKRFSGHSEPWGEFVDAKINAVELLSGEINKKKKGTVWISGVCDPYQKAEQKYILTKRCLEMLIGNGWPVVIQTKSPLVLRDIKILKQSALTEVGFTITTADEDIRRIFEAEAPSVEERIKALEILHGEGIRTYVMVAPLLPGADRLPEMVKGKIDYALIDRYNYHYADRTYKKHHMEQAMSDDYFNETGEKIKAGFESTGITCRKLY